MRWRRILKYAVILIVVAAVPLGGYVWYQRWRGEQLLQEVLAELDAEGPWTWEDMVAARQPTSDSERATALIDKVGAAAKNLYTPRAFNSLPEQPQVMLAPEQADEFMEELRKLEALVKEARTIRNLPRGRLKLEGESVGIAGPGMDRIQRARQFAGLLNLDAIGQAQLGDLDKALVDFEGIWASARAMDDELTLIAHLVRIAIEAIALGNLERTLAQGQPRVEALAQVQKAIAEVDMVKAVRTGIEGERAVIDRMCKAYAAGDKDWLNAGAVSGMPQGWDALSHAFLGVSLKSSHAFVLRHLTQVSRALDLPHGERTARLHELEQEVMSAPVFAQMLAPAVTKAHEAFSRTHAKQQCAIAALAVERFRREAGRWPKTLDELVPKFLGRVPADPCAAERVQYRATRDGVVVYSVGPEGKLDGSCRDQAKPDGRHHSYEFRLWNVPQRRQVSAR